MWWVLDEGEPTAIESHWGPWKTLLRGRVAQSRSEVLEMCNKTAGPEPVLNLYDTREAVG
jgi:hypothetical protein